MLLVHAPDDSHSRYSRYLAEILRAEGFADVAEAEFARLDEAALAGQDLLVLPRLATTAAQADLLARYVEGGGRLLACLPDDRLARRLGLLPTFAGLRAGYLHLSAGELAVRGLCAEPIQVVVPAVGWQGAPGARLRLLARVAASDEPEAATGPAGIPGVVWSRVGGGAAVLFAYDLPHAVARLRHGDPANADLCLAGLDGICRPSDLFVGQLDPRRALLPQADLHAALLARAIELLAPRPRLWYYPRAEQRSALVMTADDDWSSPAQFDAFLDGLRRRDGHCTFYLVPGTAVTPEQADLWEREGHTCSAHPALDTEIRAPLDLGEPQRVVAPAMLRRAVARHRERFGGEVRTIRHHAVRWWGYVEAARLLAELGVALECNYLSVAPFALGYLAGSGRPLRFVDPDGAIIPCYQQPTLWSEECLVHPEYVVSLRWSVARALAETGALTRRAAREFYTPVTINSHPVSYATYSRPLIEGAWDAALAEGLPIVPADEWLAWTEAREGARLVRDGDAWTLHAARALPGATVLFPPGTMPALDGTEGAGLTQQTLWGRAYQALSLDPLAAGEQRRC